MPEPAAELIQEVYTELRRLAEGYVRREQAKSVQAYALRGDCGDLDAAAPRRARARPACG